MLLLNVGNTELRVSRVTGAIVLILRKGNLSISIPIDQSELTNLINQLEIELKEIKDGKSPKRTK